MARTKMIELENKTRGKLRFPTVKRVGKQLVVDRNPGATLVLGDSADANIPDDQRTVHCPSPVVRLTEEQYNSLHARHRSTIEAMVQRGEIRRTELAA